MTYRTVILDGCQPKSQLVTNAAAVKPGTLGTVTAAGAFAVAADSTSRLFVFGDNQYSTDGSEEVAADAGGNAYEINNGDVRALILAASETIAKNDKLYIGAGGFVTDTTAGGFIGHAQESVTSGAGENPQIAVVMA